MNMSSRLWWWGQMLMVVLMAPRQNGIYAEKVLASALTHKRGNGSCEEDVDGILMWVTCTFMNNKQIMLFQSLYIISSRCSANFWQLLTTQKMSNQNQTQSSRVTMTNSKSQIIFTSCRNKACHSAQKSVMTALSSLSCQNCFYQVSPVSTQPEAKSEWMNRDILLKRWRPQCHFFFRSKKK